MIRYASGGKPTMPDGADALRRPTGEMLAREAWAPTWRSTFEVSPAGLRLGRRVFRGRAPETLADLVLAFVPGRGRKPGELGRPREHAERIAMLLRVVLAARRRRLRFLRKPALAALREAGVPDAESENQYLMMMKDRRWLEDRGLLAQLLDMAERIERTAAPRLGILTAHAPRLVVAELSPGTAKGDP
jgi:hypothetical protein